MAIKLPAKLPQTMKREIAADLCRYCQNMVKISRPRSPYVGACRYGLHPFTCSKFSLIKSLR